MWLKWFFLCSWLCKRSFPHSILIIIHLTWILDWKRLDITGVYILLATMCMFSTLAFPLWAISPASFDPYLLIQCLLTTSISSRNHFLPRTSAGGTWVCLYTRDMFHFRTTRTLIFSSKCTFKTWAYKWSQILGSFHQYCACVFQWHLKLFREQFMRETLCCKTLGALLEAQNCPPMSTCILKAILKQ